MAEIVLAGSSGAGRSAAAAVLEDLGFYVVDNLPTSLLATIVELASKAVASTAWRSSPGVTRRRVPHVGAMRVAGPRHDRVPRHVDERVIRRYDATRRKHPLADEADGCSSRSSSSAGSQPSRLGRTGDRHDRSQRAPIEGSVRRGVRQRKAQPLQVAIQSSVTSMACRSTPTS